jgi:hypothetical protein
MHFSYCTGLDMKLGNQEHSAFGKSLCTYKTRWKWCPWTTVSENWIKQLHTLLVLHFNRHLKTEYSESTSTSILTTKSTYHSLSAQRLSECTIVCYILFTYVLETRLAVSAVFAVHGEAWWCEVCSSAAVNVGCVCDVTVKGLIFEVFRFVSVTL